MARIDDLVHAALKNLGEKPPDDGPQAPKKNYSQDLSTALALAFGQELRHRGMDNARPAGPGELGAGSGAERRLAGGIGAKKVDVTWATEESGLLLGVSIKTIMFRDGKSQNYQKNLTNRRESMLFESVTLHRRFPYAVLGGFLFLDQGAEHDGTQRRRSTFANSFPRFRLFTDRRDPGSRDEKFERLYLLLVDANAFNPSVRCFHVADDDPDQPTEIALDDAVTYLVELLAERNFDTYDTDGDGNIHKS